MGTLNTNLKIGDKVQGKVVVVADYGAFEITGVEGLIHVSEMSWCNTYVLQRFHKVGDSRSCYINMTATNAKCLWVSNK